MLLCFFFVHVLVIYLQALSGKGVDVHMYHALVHVRGVSFSFVLIGRLLSCSAIIIDSVLFMCYWQCEITELGLIPQHTFNIHHDIKVLIEHHKKWWLTDFVNIALAEPVCKQTQKKKKWRCTESWILSEGILAAQTSPPMITSALTLEKDFCRFQLLWWYKFLRLPCTSCSFAWPGNRSAHLHRCCHPAAGCYTAVVAS